MVYDTLLKRHGNAKTFGKAKEMQMGMIAVLHTWGQQLSLHPHLHCIVPVVESIEMGSGKTQEPMVNSCSQ
jgi:hypothetical protein